MGGKRAEVEWGTEVTHVAKQHQIHTDQSGKYRWTEEHGLYKDDQAFARHKVLGGPELPEQGGERVDLPLVILRCRCGDPDSHASRGQHCPDAEIDVGETYTVSTTLNSSQS